METESLQRNSKLGSCVNILFSGFWSRQKEVSMVHTKGSGSSYSNLFYFTLGRDYNSLATDMSSCAQRGQKEMLLRFSSSWWPSVPMWYKKKLRSRLEDLIKEAAVQWAR